MRNRNHIADILKFVYNFIMDKIEEKVFAVHNLPQNNNVYDAKQNVSDKTDEISPPASITAPAA
ncbi:MAG: hypothetical protein LBG46_00285 [Elusimicrobiota bacterium]|nr:hypothetical protein [Elusimicrobiota bacterium]